MKHSLEERMDIGRRMYLHEITYKEAMEIYGLSESCAHKYMTDYKKALVILLIGGGALAIVNFLQMIITVTRKQKLLNIGYLLAFLLFVFGGKTITEKHGMIGISVFYTAVVMILGAVFIVLTIGIIKGYANSDGKTVAEKKQ